MKSRPSSDSRGSPPRGKRSRTLTRRDLAREVRAHREARLRERTAANDDVITPLPRPARPLHRSECVGGPRPCPWISCRYHLYLDVNPKTGSVKLNFPDLEVWELEETCALDIADRGETTLDRIGHLLDLTRERIRQLEHEGLGRLRRAWRRARLADPD